MQRRTFADLGMPFPLFEAPTVDASGFQPAGDCNGCGARAVAVFEVDGVHACYACLRGGRAPWTKDTELGLVTAESAAAGRTEGTPSPPETGFELEALPIDAAFPEQRWFSAKIPREHLDELLRTPNYATWQGEQWIFCCQRPAVFVGAWDIGQWEAAAEEFDLALEDLLADTLGVTDSELDTLLEALEAESDSLVTYVFRCPACAALLGHYDRD